MQIHKQPELAAYSERVSSRIIERLFLPRKPGVFAYAANAPVRISTMVTTQSSRVVSSL